MKGIVVAALAAALILFGLLTRDEPCKVKWQAMSVSTERGPVVTSNCDPEGKP